MTLSTDQLYEHSIALLRRLIATPSFSREESGTAALIEEFFQQWSIPVKRQGNNIWATNLFFDPSRPTILLCSHHDTVKPASGYTRDPFSPDLENGRLFGLGSNDAGGCLVALVAAFAHFYDRPDMNYNLVMAATAEEEVSGLNGIEGLWGNLPPIAFAIIGEPTRCDMAIAEKGLMVLDCLARGKAGHAARQEGVNAIYKAMDDIAWFRNFKFPKVSATLGEVKMSVTVIHAGQAHNQVPADCAFTIDVRVTDAYSLEEVLSIIRAHVLCDVTPRSMRLRPSGISKEHPLVTAGAKTGRKFYGSPTTSDQALIPVPSVKIGPGDSARSHTADEFIFVNEVHDGLEMYIHLLDELMNTPQPTTKK